MLALDQSPGPEMLTDDRIQAPALSTSRSTLAPTAATLALASESVRSDPIPTPLRSLYLRLCHHGLRTIDRPFPTHEYSHPILYTFSFDT